MSNDFLLADARRFLTAAEDSPSVQRYRRELPLSKIWEENAADKAKHLAASSFTEAVAGLENRLFFHGRSKREAELAVDWFCLNGIPGLPCSDFIPEEYKIQNGPFLYWHDDFRHNATIHRVLDAMALSGASQFSRVVELGAGCGDFARLLKQHERGIKYLIIDGLAKAVRDCGRGMTEYLVPYGKSRLRVIYSPSRNIIVTALPIKGRKTEHKHKVYRDGRFYNCGSR